MADDDARKENREQVWLFMDRARNAESGRGRGEEAEAVAIINVGGAIAYGLLDLADAIREHGRSGECRTRERPAAARGTRSDGP